MSGLLGVKLRRDLRASWPRFVLMVIALAVSLTVFGGMLFAWAAVSSQTGSAYLSTEPASATIVLDKGIDAERMAAVAAQVRTVPGVIEATGRTQFDSEVDVNGEPRDIPLQVFAAAPDDPMRMVKFDLRQDGSWPPAAGEIMLGRDGSLDLLGAAVGDTVTVTVPGGEPARLRVVGTVYDPSLAPSPQEQKGHGYLATSALPLDQVKIQVAERERGAIVAVAADVGRRLQREYALTIAEIQVPKPYAHPHQWQADVLLLSLVAGGAAALLLSTILVATMLNNLFTQQVPQIGIMKAIGARSVRIGRLYLAMTLLVAAAATVLAMPPAVLLSQNLARGLLGMLGIQPFSVSPPLWTVLVVLAAGLGLPPLMALPPLVRASRITVRAAIDHHGGGAKPSRATGLLARLGSIRRLDRGLLMAARNTVRRPARFWLSVGLLATAGTAFVAGMSLTSATQAADEQKKQQRYWDVAVELAGPAHPEVVTGAVRQVAGVSRVEAWYRAEVGVAGPGQLPVTRTYPDQGHGRVSLNTLPVLPKLLEGRLLKPAETGAVVLDQKTVSALGVGDTVQLFIDGRPTTWRIVGVVEETDGGGAYTTAEGLAAATGQPHQVNQLRIITDTHDEPTRQAVANAVEATLNTADAASVSRSEAASAGHMAPVIAVLLVVALPLGLIGGIGLAATMSANVLDRYREFGIMHAIGAPAKAVRRIVVAEGVLLALTSCLVAAVPALVLTRILGVGLGNLFGNTPLPYRVSALGVGVWLALAVLGSMLATEAAASRASRITVREALTYL